MRRNRSKLLILVLCFMIIFTAAKYNAYAAVRGVTDDGIFSYTLKDGMAVLTLTETVFGDDFTTPSENLVIPGMVRGYKVSEVKFDIFSNVSLKNVPTRKLIFDNVCFEYDEEKEASTPKLTMSQNIKNLITDIEFMPNCSGEYFPRNYLSGFSSLEKINIPEGITTLGIYSLFGCSSLKELALPDSLIMFEAYCIEGCDNLEKIYYNNEERIRAFAKEQLSNNLETADIIPRKDISGCTISGINDEVIIKDKDETVVFNDITVTDNGRPVEYRTAYANNKGPGAAHVMLSGMYDYCGRITRTFSILSDEPSTAAPMPTGIPTAVPADVPADKPGNAPVPTPEIKYLYIPQPMVTPTAPVPLKPVKSISCKKIPSGKKGAVLLSWKYSKADCKFHVYRKMGKGKYKKIGVALPYKKKTAFYDYGLNKKKVYTYKVCAVYNDNEVRSKFKIQRVRF